MRETRLLGADRILGLYEAGLITYERAMDLLGYQPEKELISRGDYYQDGGLVVLQESGIVEGWLMRFGLKGTDGREFNQETHTVLPGQGQQQGARA